MAPSMSPVFPVRALDVRHPHYVYDPMLGVRDHEEGHAATSSGGVSGAVIGLSVLSGIIAVAAFVAIWYVVRQRQQLKTLGTIRVLYNVDNLKQDADAEKTEEGIVVSVDAEKRGSSLAPIPEGEKLYTIDLSDESKPRIVPSPRFAATGDAPHLLPRRKFSRLTARQKLRIVIPSGVAIPDVELVMTATPGLRSGVSSAVSATRTSAVSRRNTARTPRSALSSAVTAISTAAISVVQRREKVEPVYKSNGWAPATMVYLPQNPRDNGPTNTTTAAAATRSPNPRKLPRKPVRRSNTVAVGPGQLADKLDLVQ